jgi:hypothetical protein
MEIKKPIVKSKNQRKPMRGGLRPGCGRPKGARTERTRAIAKQVALTGETPLEVMMQGMRHYLRVGDLENAIAVAKLAAPYMHPRLHAVANADAAPGRLEKSEQSLAMIARKVAFAFRIAAQGAEAKQIEDAGDGA